MGKVVITITDKEDEHVSIEALFDPPISTDMKGKDIPTSHSVANAMFGALKQDGIEDVSFNEEADQHD